MPSQERDVIHFFKVILEKNLLDDGFLKLPKSFVREYWNRITSRSVVLSLPNGAEWEVHWTRDENGDVLFNNGWKEFAQYVSLQASQFLLFGYELKKTNNNKFYVNVFSTSGLEIKYPCSNNSVSKKKDDNVNIVEKGQKGNKSAGCSVEIVNRKRRRSPLRRLPSPPPPQPQIIIKEDPENNSINGETNNMKGKRRASGSFIDHIAKEKDYDDHSLEVLDNKIMKKFQERVKSRFHSWNPFFVCSLGKTYSDRDLLVIPSDFAKPILDNREGNAKLFHVDPKKNWDVKMRLSASRQLTITNGWKKFSTFHSLKLGDVCVFELVNPIDMLFKVHFRRFGEDSLTPISPEYSEQEGPSYRPPSSSPFLKKHKTANKANSGFMPKNDFTIPIKHATLASHYAVIPIEYLRNYSVRSGTIATLQVDENREWKVKLLYYPHNGYARFSQGWTKFTKECKLEYGDSCHFELIDLENLKFQVSITKGH